MNNQSLSGKNLLSVIDFVLMFKQACNSSRVHEDAAAQLFQDFITSLALVAIRTRPTMSSNYVNIHKETSRSYVEVINHLLRRYSTNAPIAKAYEKSENSSKKLNTMEYFPETVKIDSLLWRILQTNRAYEASSYNEPGWTSGTSCDNGGPTKQEATLREWAHHVQFLLDL